MYRHRSREGARYRAAVRSGQAAHSHMRESQGRRQPVLQVRVGMAGRGAGAGGRACLRATDESFSMEH